MSEQVHGHEVMRMMLEEGGAFTRETLHTTIVERFGEKTRFYTCSAENLTAEELVMFLESRGKFVGTDRGFNTGTDKICNH